MNWRTLAGLAMAVGLTTAGCASIPGAEAVRAPEPTKTFLAERLYTGRWYEVARTPAKITDGCVAGTTDYIARAGGVFQRDACRVGTPAGKEKVIGGPLTILNPGQNNKVRVNYRLFGFIPLARQYWMLDRDEDYRWFIAADPSYDLVILYTRDPRPSAAEIARLTARAAALGYDTRLLEYPEPFPAGSQ